MSLWPWSHRGDRANPELRVDADPQVAAAEERVADLERRADAAEERLAAILPRLDPWVDSVLGTIHNRGRHVR